MAIPSVQQFSQQPGGGLVTAMRGMNALNEERLKAQNQALQNQYYPQDIQSQINYRGAETNKLNAMTPLEAQNQQNINDWYARKAQADINAQNALVQYRNMGGGYGMGAGQKDILGLQRQIASENPDWTPEKVNQAASAYIDGNETLPDGTKLDPASGIVQAYRDQIVKRGTTAQGLNQQRFAATTDAILDQGKELIPIVSKYSGILGKGKGGLNAVQSGLGVNTPEYNNYVYFTRTFVPYAAGEMMRALGVNASDTQKDLYQKVINPISWDVDPNGMTQIYNKMTNLFKQTVSKTVGKGTAEIRSGLRSGDKKSSSNVMTYNLQTGMLE